MGNKGRKWKKGWKNGASIFSAIRPPAFSGTERPQKLMKLLEGVNHTNISPASQKKWTKVIKQRPWICDLDFGLFAIFKA